MTPRPILGHPHSAAHPAAPTRSLRSTATLCGLAACAALLSACPSYSILQSPQNLKAGETRISVAPSLVSGVGATSTGGAGATLPTAELGLRHGITDTVEFGAKLYPFGLYTDFKFQLVDSDMLDLSVAPGWSLGGISLGLSNDELDLSGAGGGFMLRPQLPVLIGLNLTERGTAVIVPKVAFAVGLAAGSNSGVQGGAGVQAGLGLGWHWAVTPTFAVMPEINFNRNVAGSAGLSGLGGKVEANLGFHFGGKLGD